MRIRLISLFALSACGRLLAPPGDCNGDGRVDMADLAIVAANWLAEDPEVQPLTYEWIIRNWLTYYRQSWTGDGVFLGELNFPDLGTIRLLLTEPEITIKDAINRQIVEYHARASQVYKEIQNDNRN